MKKINQIKCPTCGKKNTWKESNKTKPFCSEPCKLIDLGEWASETHVIPGEEISSDLINDEDSNF
jgi:endogenous inhibitor of DNA gyrase (YacG/DUF329 family)